MAALDEILFSHCCKSLAGDEKLTSMFIELRAKYDDKIANRKYQSKEAWKKIASELYATGHLDWQKCSRRGIIFAESIRI